MNDCRKRHTNLGISWIDHKKPYDMIPHSRILESLKLVIFKLVSESFVHFIRKSIKNWNTKVSSSYGEYLAKVDIRRSTFQGDSYLCNHTFMMSIWKGQERWGVWGRDLKFVTCLQIIVFLSNRSIQHFCGWKAWASQDWSFFVSVINVWPPCAVRTILQREA